ncbi:hypothetical protein V6N12_050506 [Hibiscus sabdariffa]|uniref:Uncharacterized protein n=1 Tax=Hibiscus sabdariffa TaxID=183260 RepID=A0ABR2GCK5_9ROSI
MVIKDDINLNDDPPIVIEDKCLSVLVSGSKNPAIHKNTKTKSKNASFFENVFPYKAREVDRSSIERILKTIDEDSSDDEQRFELEIEP